MSDVYARIAKAAPFIDADWNGEGWAPSQLLTIGYCALVTGNIPEEAAPFVRRHLDLAAERFRLGQKPPTELGNHAEGIAAAIRNPLHQHGESK